MGLNASHIGSDVMQFISVCVCVCVRVLVVVRVYVWAPEL